MVQVIFEELSGHFGTSRISVMRAPQYFGSRGSSVRIRPRRPIKSNIYTNSTIHSYCPILSNSARGAFVALGTNSGHETHTASADFKLNSGAEELVAFSHCTKFSSKLNSSTFSPQPKKENLMKRKYTRAQVKKVKELKAKGSAFKTISKLTGVPEGTLTSLFNADLRNYPVTLNRSANR